MNSAAEPLDQRPTDLRLVVVGLALWAGALTGLTITPRPAVVAVVVMTVTAAVLALRGHGDVVARTIAVVIVSAAVGVSLGAARAAPVRDGPVAQLADRGAYVQVEGVIAADPDLRGGAAAFPDGLAHRYVVGRLRVDLVTGRGQTHDVRSPVVLVADDTSWSRLLPGQRVRASGRLAPAEGGPVAAVLEVDGPPATVGGPGAIARATEPLRSGLREAVSGVPEDARGLVPAMVVGDESLMTDQVRADMRATGLAHLTAVSGTNVTIVLVVVLGLARWGRVRGYLIPVTGAVAVVGFVLLARPEPSVVRAAAMGTIAVIGMSVAGRRRGLSALAAAGCVLLLVDPWLAQSVGFALSVLATAGILTLAPAWQRALSWLPRPLAVAVAVPLVAQLACLPLVLATFDEVSLAGLPANIAVAPAVAPATVLGVGAAVVAPIAAVPASALGWLAGLATGWIVRVAAWFAGLPGAVAPWPDGVGAVVAAVIVTALALATLPWVLRRRALSVVAAALLTIGLVRVVPTPGWPPPDWSVVACDVGQGDALAIRAGPGAAVVVDAGPEPRAVRRCLDTLGVREVPLLVLTHFHADHVSGLPGVLAGRRVGRALVSPLAEPEPNAARVDQLLAQAAVPATVARAGMRIQVSTALHLHVVWPRRLIESGESAANNASVVLVADTGGLRVLLTGDLEPTAQAALLRAEPDLDVDVLKVAHHGSPHQDAELLTGVGAELALVSVGENDYGHPSTAVVARLHTAGIDVRRTDEGGSIAVVRRGDGRIGVMSAERGAAARAPPPLARHRHSRPHRHSRVWSHR